MSPATVVWFNPRCSVVTRVALTNPADYRPLLADLTRRGMEILSTEPPTSQPT
jgi:hypothetical protein